MLSALVEALIVGGANRLVAIAETQHFHRGVYDAAEEVVLRWVQQKEEADFMALLRRTPGRGPYA